MRIRCRVSRPIGEDGVGRDLFFTRGRGELHGFRGEAARVRRLAGRPAGHGACQPGGRGMRIRHRVSTPIGELVLLGTTAGLSEIRFPHAAAVDDADDGELPEAAAEIEAYFAGRLREFTIPLVPAGTRFQHQVWRLLREIPFGATTTYGALARRLGKASAARAVGLANGSNPLPIIVPCHRVIGSNGKLTGFAGGLPMKAWLLDWERRCNFFGADGE